MKHRDEPVIWARNPRAGSRLSHYEANGYYTSKLFINPEIARSARDEALELKAHARKLPSAIFEKDGTTLRSLFDVHHLPNTHLMKLITPEMIEFAEDIVGSRVYIHQFHINYKQRFRGGDFFWHSDYTFWYWEDGMMLPRCPSFVIPLDYMTVEAGPLMVAPGSHRYYGHSKWFRDEQDASEAVKHEMVGDPEKNGLATTDQLQMLEDSNLYVFRGEPGDMMVMDANLLHASGPNISPWDRMVAFICLNSVDNKLQDPPSGQPHRPEYITSQDYTPL